jgi:leucyl-tRNA synthetase
MVIQVNGKLRSKLDVAKDTSKEQLEALALADDTVRKFIAELTVRKVIVVPGKLINVVAT